MKVWSEIHPAGGDFSFQPGERYAVLASASKDYSVDQIQKYVGDHGFTVSYAWEQGDPSRDQYAIDDWLAALMPDTTENHRWVYAEGDFTGERTWSVGQSAPWPLTIYSIAHVFAAVDAPAPVTPGDTPAAPSLPATSSPTSSGPGVVVVLLGLAVVFVGGFFLGRHV